MAIKATRNGGGNGDDGYGLIGGDAPQRRTFSADDIVIGGPMESAPTSSAPMSTVPKRRSQTTSRSKTTAALQKGAKNLDYLVGNFPTPLAAESVEDKIVREQALGAVEQKSEERRSQGSKKRVKKNAAIKSLNVFAGSAPAKQSPYDELKYTLRGPEFQDEASVTLARQDYLTELALRRLMRPATDRPRELTRRPSKSGLYTGPTTNAYHPVRTTTFYEQAMRRNSDWRNTAASEDRTTPRQGYEGLMSATQAAESAIAMSPQLTGRQYAYGMAKNISNAQGGLSGYGGAAAMGALVAAKEGEQHKKAAEQAAAAKAQEQMDIENAPSMEQLQGQIARAKSSVASMLAPPSTPAEKAKETRSKNAVRKAAYNAKQTRAARMERTAQNVAGPGGLQGYGAIFKPTEAVNTWIAQDKKKVMANRVAELRAASAAKKKANQ